MTLFLVGDIQQRALRMKIAPTRARRAWLMERSQVVRVQAVKRGSVSTNSIPARDTISPPIENQNTCTEKWT